MPRQPLSRYHYASVVIAALTSYHCTALISVEEQERGAFATAGAGTGTSCLECATPSAEGTTTDGLGAGTGTSASFAPTSDEKKEDCPGDTKLPAGCELLAGTSERSARWLECWRQKSTDICNIGDVCFYALGSCPLSSTERTEIADACKGKPTVRERIECAGLKTREKLKGDKSNRCTHHAICLEVIGEAMGVDTNYEYGCFGPGKAHAWDEIPDGHGTIIADSYNEIYYRCPK